ncbi:MAG TPA: TonB-dependent receptor, partial [Chthoniobacteraceae bacterium]
LWTTYQLPWKIELGAGAQFVGSRFANTINTREADSYWTFDAMLKYKVTENIDLRVNVYNLADEEYLDSIGGGHVVPGAGRSATVTASFHF